MLWIETKDSEEVMIIFEHTMYNLHRMAIHDFVIWFSYNTPIAFKLNYNTPIVVCQNVWSQTTNSHLNSLDGGSKASRIPYKEFIVELNLALEERIRP
jgi:hypothetical protein